MARRISDNTTKVPTEVEGEIDDKAILLNKFPDSCPACKRGIKPIFCYAFTMDVIDDPFSGASGISRVVFRCPFRDCGKLFVTRYFTSIHRNDYYLDETYELHYVEFVHFPDSIKKISEKFSKIYNQSNVAENNGLNEICGAGYKKALEFLIKDYLIKKTPDLADDIKKEFLGESIKRIDDRKIKQTSERAVWLANDESHYVRKWEEKDIKDLKILIQLVVNWIDSSILTDDFIADMQPKKD